MMSPKRPRTVRRAIASLFVAALAAPALAQDEGPPPPPDPAGGDTPTIDVPMPQMDAAQQEMIELFGKVERQLRRIDMLLSEAGSGDTSRLQEVEESGIDELIRGSVDTGRQTLKDIDRILEIASQMGGQQQQGGSGQQQQQPQRQPGGQQQGQEQGQRENTPEQPGGQQPDQSQPQGEGEPRSPRESDDPNATNEAGDEPPQDETGEGARPAHAGERWGDLPVHVREIFRTEGDRHMPARYRDWIDSYYRKLARRGDRR
jgi:hypothetical protein